MVSNRLSAVWFPLLLCLGLQIIFVATGSSPVLEGGLVGPDSYMRLNRVAHFVAEGGWLDPAFPRSNAPYGEVLHWTRPFDVLLLIGAWPAALVTEFPTALFWSGALMSPVLQVLAVVALGWAAAPIFDRRRLVYLGILFLLQPALANYFLAGRADHHSLILVLFALLLGFALRLVQRPFRPGLCHAAGAVAGLALWVSVESTVALFLTMGALGLFWIVAGRDFHRKSLHVAVALVAATTLAMLLNKPWDHLPVPEYDRLSIVHWTLTALIAGFWAVVSLTERRSTLCATPAGRLMLAVAGLLGAAGVMWLAFPKVFLGPLADVDPGIVSIWLSQVQEVRPLITLEGLSLAWPIFWLGIAIPSLPFLIWMLWRERGSGIAGAWIYVAIGLLVYVPLSFYQVRWATYAELLLILPYTELLVRLLRRTRALGPPLVQDIARAALVAAFCVAFPILGRAVAAVEAGPFPVAYGTDCPLPAMARYLDDRDGWGDRERTILALMDFGPELLYRTRHRVIATPYHRNGAGIIDTHRFMTATDEAVARGLAESRRFDLVLTCRSPVEAAAFAADHGRPTLYQRLRAGEHPPWLRQVALPPHLADRFALFEVIR
ncbi:MAG: hypothetical protein ACE5JZ_08590 [Kiloniellales bacterium]